MADMLNSLGENPNDGSERSMKTAGQEGVLRSAEPLDVLVLVGSPNAAGKSAALAHQLDLYLQAEGAKPCVFELAKYPVAACTNCGHCQATGSCAIVNDAWGVLARHLESADLVFVIAPAYFAGPAAHLKAALDRCQMYWARKYLLHEGVPAEKPAHLLVLGDGHNPFGIEPLAAVVKSALNCANVRIEGRVHNLTADAYHTLDLPTFVAQALDEVR